ncbi:DNA alkylation repair protein [soil metagenome]
MEITNARKRGSGTKTRTPAVPSPIAPAVNVILASLKKVSSKRTREEMQPRYGIVTDKALGVAMSAMMRIAKQSRGSSPKWNHELAAVLWKTGWYEARMVACMVDEAALVTPAQMDRWCRDFDNWGIVDTVCFKLFDRSPHAWAKVFEWSDRRDEFQKRAAFALLASVALHDKKSSDDAFERCLPLIERAAADNRNFVKKGVSWALRSMGRRGPALRAAARRVALRLAESSDATQRWVGKDSLKDLDGK